jgi:hypothetical protein
MVQPALQFALDVLGVTNSTTTAVRATSGNDSGNGDGDGDSDNGTTSGKDHGNINVNGNINGNDDHGTFSRATD